VDIFSKSPLSITVSFHGLAASAIRRKRQSLRVDIKQTPQAAAIISYEWLMTVYCCLRRHVVVAYWLYCFVSQHSAHIPSHLLLLKQASIDYVLKGVFHNVNFDDWNLVWDRHRMNMVISMEAVLCSRVAITKYCKSCCIMYGLFVILYIQIHGLWTSLIKK